MIARNLTVALLAGITAYLITQLFWAPYARPSYDRLRGYHSALTASVATIQHRHDELTAQTDALRSNAGAISVLARSLQLYDTNVSVLRLSGARARRAPMSPGSVMRRPAPLPDRRTDGLLVAAAAALVALLIGMVSTQSRQSASMRRASR